MHQIRVDSQIVNPQREQVVPESYLARFPYRYRNIIFFGRVLHVIPLGGWERPVFVGNLPPAQVPKMLSLQGELDQPFFLDDFAHPHLVQRFIGIDRRFFPRLNDSIKPHVLSYLVNPIIDLVVRLVFHLVQRLAVKQVQICEANQREMVMMGSITLIWISLAGRRFKRDNFLGRVGGGSTRQGSGKYFICPPS